MPTPTETAPRDGNNITAKMAVLNTDTVQGTHLVEIKVDAVSGGIKYDRAATISFTMVPVDPRDQNYAPVWLFEGLDGLVYPAVATAAGALLVDET